MGWNCGQGIMVKNWYVFTILKLGRDSVEDITHNPEHHAESDPLQSIIQSWSSSFYIERDHNHWLKPSKIWKTLELCHFGDYGRQGRSMKKGQSCEVLPAVRSDRRLRWNLNCWSWSSSVDPMDVRSLILQKSRRPNSRSPIDCLIW